MPTISGTGDTPCASCGTNLGSQSVWIGALKYHPGCVPPPSPHTTPPASEHAELIAELRAAMGRYTPGVSVLLGRAADALTKETR